MNTDYAKKFNCLECEEIPCIKHVDQACEEELNSPEAKRYFLSQVPGEIDMSGPDE